MAQTSYDFMSKDYKHVLIQKVTFSTEKELLTQPYTRKPRTNTQKPMCTLVKQCCVNTPIFLSTQRSAVLFPHRLCLPFTTIFS